MEEEKKKKKKEEGVLLYYKYANVPDLGQLLNFYNSNCKSLSLRGRVRLAPHGVNVTVGGRLSCLEQHIAAVKTNSLFEGTDFKLAACSLQSDDQIMEECGFTSLSIRIVKELVTFNSNLLLKSPDISNAGKHLSAVEFNTVLHNAGASSENNCTDQHNKIILLDARNVYETRIGRFETPKVENLDPKIRQYSDLCTWIDSHSEQLRGNSVLMYCTGGIRCEMASAYIRSKGAGFENVFQLYGGIQRYLEQFPNGGFFKGKNFVFDPRISVGCSDADIVGSCLLCESPFDDYSSRCRCVYCRMLVLVCDDCKKHNGAKYVCELCQKHSKKGVVPLDKSCSYQTIMTMPAISGSIELESTTLLNHTTSSHQLPLGPESKPSRKLKILCLHGFRQNASNFKGRTASLAKKLKNVVELVYIDAPHELPFIFRPLTIDTSHTSIGLSLSEQRPPPSEKCKKRFAWLVEKGRNNSAGTNWESAEEPFDTLQYKKQTDGYGVSLSYLKDIFLQMGPFDGVLGFSQGAAMAASLCAEKEKLKGEIDFSFAILSSGYSLNLEGLDTGSLDIPSLHIFGNHPGKDRQISCQESKTLASLFKESCSTIITHESGHIIPTQPSYIDQIKLFLDQFI